MLGADRPANGIPFDLGVAARSKALARSWIQRGDVGIGRAAVGRIVLEAAVRGRIVRRRDDDAVALVFGAATIIDEDGVRDDGRRGHAVVALQDRLDPLGRQNLERRSLRRAGKGVRVFTEKKRAIDRLARGGNRRSPG